MHRSVIEVNGVGYDSVYAFIKAYKITHSPQFVYEYFILGSDAGDVIECDLECFVHFRGCSDKYYETFEIKILELI